MEKTFKLTRENFEFIKTIEPDDSKIINNLITIVRKECENPPEKDLSLSEIIQFCYEKRRKLTTKEWKSIDFITKNMEKIQELLAEFDEKTRVEQSFTDEFDNLAISEPPPSESPVRSEDMRCSSPEEKLDRIKFVKTQNITVLSRSTSESELMPKQPHIKIIRTKTTPAFLHVPESPAMKGKRGVDQVISQLKKIFENCKKFICTNKSDQHLSTKDNKLDNYDVFVSIWDIEILIEVKNWDSNPISDIDLRRFYPYLSDKSTPNIGIIVNIGSKTINLEPDMSIRYIGNNIAFHLPKSDFNCIELSIVLKLIVHFTYNGVELPKFIKIKKDEYGDVDYKVDKININEKSIKLNLNKFFTRFTYLNNIQLTAFKIEFATFVLDYDIYLRIRKYGKNTKSSYFKDIENFYKSIDKNSTKINCFGIYVVGDVNFIKDKGKEKKEEKYKIDNVLINNNMEIYHYKTDKDITIIAVPWYPIGHSGQLISIITKIICFYNTKVIQERIKLFTVKKAKTMEKINKRISDSL